jgi:hypothetical protein
MSNTKHRAKSISRISIENFKAFGKRVDVPIRPITLIFGENSSGKSSILHSLLFLNQMRHQPQDKLADITYTKAGGNSVDLGGLPQLKYGHMNSENLSFRIERVVSWNNRRPLFRLSLSPEAENNYLFERDYFFACKYTFDNVNEVNNLEYFINDVCIGSLTIPSKESEVSPKIKIYLNNLIGQADLELNDRLKANLVLNDRLEDELSQLENNSDSTASNFLIDKLAKSNFSSSIIEYVLSDSAEDIQNFINYMFVPRGYRDASGLDGSYNPRYRVRFYTLQGLDGDLHKITSDYSRMKPSSKSPGSALVQQPIPFDQLLDSFMSIIELKFLNLCRHVDNLKYLGPIRTIPTRNFDTPDSISRDPSTGSTAWDLLANNPTAREHVNYWLDKFGTGKQIQTEQLVDSAQIYKLLDKKRTNAQFKTEIQKLSKRPLLRFYDSLKDIYLSHRDFGVGISQVLPVIVNCVANSNTTVLIEQPELHLHPRLQGDLADLFIETAITGSQHNTYLLETHSEALILRLLRRVREGVIKPDDIAILYVSAGEEGSNVTHIRIDEDGDFMDRWPNGFFEETYRDRMGF